MTDRLSLRDKKRLKARPFSDRALPRSVSFNDMCSIAYIDPGSGALIWQMLLAIGVGVLFYVKKSRDYLASLARRLFRKD